MQAIIIMESELKGNNEKIKHLQRANRALKKEIIKEKRKLVDDYLAAQEALGNLDIQAL